MRFKCFDIQDQERFENMSWLKKEMHLTEFVYLMVCKL